MSTSSREEEQYVDLTPNESRNASDSQLTQTTKEKYLAAYENFMQWKNSNNAQSFSEDVFLAYFNELANTYKPTSLWCIYSMLKNIVKTKHDIDMKTYTNLTGFIKRRSEGYIVRKSKVLSPNNVEKFLKDAPDSRYLATKVALIFGITGACRRQDLNDITTSDVETHDDMIRVKIKNTKNKNPRYFTIHGTFYEIVKKYQDLRSTNAKNDRFFQNFQKGKCTAQPIGINKFGAMPKEIAKFLNLPEAEAYTGHSFKRTSATLMANSGTEILSLRNHNGWQSDTEAESYVEDSVDSEANTSAKLTREINLEPQKKKICPEPRQSTSRGTYLVDIKQETLDPNNDPLNFKQSFTSYENISSPPTFNQENENFEIINNTNTITQTVKMPDKTVHYHFDNCTFTNCFNN